jgi:hypothetical protein
VARRYALRSTRERLLILLTATAIAELLWVIYLGWTLPRHYVANHWEVAWVGLDVAEIGMLLATAWAAWRQRAVVILFSIVLATLLIVDAWFDITTARRGDLLQGALLAIFVEIPLAALLLWIAWRASRRLVATHLDHGDLLVTPVRRVTLLPPEDGND